MKNNDLTIEAALVIQFNHLSQWATILKPEVMELVRQKAKLKNIGITDGYSVWRGCNVDSFIHNVSARLIQGASLKQIDITSDYAALLQVK